MKIKDIIYPDQILMMIKNQQPGNDPLFYMETYDLWWNYIFKYLNLDEDSNILDIGSGCGAFSIFFYNEFKCNTYLLDTNTKTENLKPPVWDTSKVSDTCSFDAVEEFLHANSIKKYNLIEPSVNWETLPDFDIIISKSSWGIHYSYDKYMIEVLKKIKQNSLLFLNIRKKEKKDRLGQLSKYGFSFDELGAVDPRNKTFLYVVKNEKLV